MALLFFSSPPLFSYFGSLLLPLPREEDSEGKGIFWRGSLGIFLRGLLSLPLRLERHPLKLVSLRLATARLEYSEGEMRRLNI